jgi:hypothetical protein
MTTDFLVNRQPPTGEASDQYIEQIDGFSLNGTPAPLPGLNSTFGLYFEGTLALHANGPVSVYDSGTFALMADPTNNDGSLSATTSGVNFSNQPGTADDVALATGSLSSGTFGLQSNGITGLHLLETFAGENGFLVNPDSPHTVIDQLFFNTPTSRVVLPPDSNGVVFTLKNDGFGVLDIAVPEPGTLGLLASGLIGLLALRRRSL